MTLGQSDNAAASVPTTMWLGKAPLVSMAGVDRAEYSKAHLVTAAPTDQHAAGIRCLDQIANLLEPIGVSDQLLQPQSP